MGNRPVLTRTRQPAGAAGAHLCAPPAPTQQHTGVWDTCRNTSPANLCQEPLLRSAQRPSEKGASTARIVLGDATPLQTAESSNDLRTQPPQRSWPRHHACCTARSRDTVTRDRERRRCGVGPMRRRVSSSDLAEPQECAYRLPAARA